MKFKKFREFLNEIAGPPVKGAGKKKEKDPKDIESADPLTPPIDPEVVTKCPKCGATSMVCGCFTDDYYNAKLPQQAPKPSTTKPKSKRYE
jgi:hypothetical protein